MDTYLDTTGYEGWQAVDSTPQEASENIMRCGPCPLGAIKEGDIYLPYDCGFMFAEVCYFILISFKSVLIHCALQ